MKWFDQYKQLPNQSVFHEDFRQLLCSEKPFCNYKCFQEVAVVSLFPEYPNTKHRYDWYIEELRTIVELHGKQHYMPVGFGKASFETIQRDFLAQKNRDWQKKQIAIENNFNYVEIPFNFKLTKQTLLEKILETI